MWQHPTQRRNTGNARKARRERRQRGEKVNVCSKAKNKAISKVINEAKNEAVNEVVNKAVNDELPKLDSDNEPQKMTIRDTHVINTLIGIADNISFIFRLKILVSFLNVKDVCKIIRDYSYSCMDTDEYIFDRIKCLGLLDYIQFAKKCALYFEKTLNTFDTPLNIENKLYSQYYYTALSFDCERFKRFDKDTFTYLYFEQELYQSTITYMNRKINTTHKLFEWISKHNSELIMKILES